jgi:hypothetical protein
MRSLPFLSAAVLWLAFAAPAQAINGYDCTQTLRDVVPHVGYHGMESPSDIKRRWNKIEAERGVNITQSWAVDWGYIVPSPNKVWVDWSFMQANGHIIRHYFRCDDYRPYGGGYTDDYWYYRSG